MNGELKSKVIVVAGGAGQIGFSFSKAIANEGANVIIADIDIENAKKKMGKEEKLFDSIFTYSLDTTDPRGIVEFYDFIYRRYGAVDGLVNSFHYKGNTRRLDEDSDFFTSVEEYPLSSWDMVMNVNLKGSFLMIKNVLKYMKINGGGSIVNVSSTYGIVSPNKNIYGNSGINSPIAYAVSKAGLLNMTRYIATHYAEFNIRCNTLSPGGVYNNQDEDFIRNYESMTPMRRMAKDTDYNGGLIFLLSDKSEYMTGANLVIDGGWTAW